MGVLTLSTKYQALILKFIGKQFTNGMYLYKVTEIFNVYRSPYKQIRFTIIGSRSAVGTAFQKQLNPRPNDIYGEHLDAFLNRVKKGEYEWVV